MWVSALICSVREKRMHSVSPIFVFSSPQIEPGHGHSESSVYPNFQDLKISHSHSPPQPSGSPLHVSGDWETYKDHCGRHYYYNRTTQERAWKPPRAKDASIVSARENRHSTGEGSEVSV